MKQKESKHNKMLHVAFVSTKGVVVVLFVLTFITNMKEVSLKLGSMKSVCMCNTESLICDYSVYSTYHCTVIIA